MKKISFLIALFLFAGTHVAVAQQLATKQIVEQATVRIPASDEIIGLWWTPEKDAKVEIYKEEGKFFGKIVWLQNPTLTDDRNENPELNGRSILGINLLEGFEYNKRKKEWDEGAVYEPYRGKTYASFLKLHKRNMNKLLVRGFLIGARFLGKTETFTRVK